MGKIANVLTIGQRTFVPEWSEVEFVDPMSTHDFDVVLWGPNNITRGLSSPGMPTDMRRVEEAVIRRSEEFKVFLERGGIMIVFVEAERLFDRHQDHFSSQGKIGGWNAYPFNPPQIVASGGRTITLRGNDGVSSFMRAEADRMRYSATISADEDEGVTVIATAGRTDRAVAAEIRYPGGGRLILLPDMERSFTITDGDPMERMLDNPATVDLDESALFYKKLINSFSAPSAEPAPEWADNAFSSRERSLVATLREKKEELTQLGREIDKTLEAKDQLDSEKILLHGTGSELEDAVASALELFGATRLETEGNRADLRLSYDDKVVVVEVKGVGKSASETNAVQLEKWVSEEAMFGTPYESIKALLVVNAFRGRRPEERARAFPDQMLGYSTPRRHALVTSAQLFVMVDDVHEGRMTPDEAMRVLLDLVGTLDGYEITPRP